MLRFWKRSRFRSLLALIVFAAVLSLRGLDVGRYSAELGWPTREAVAGADTSLRVVDDPYVSLTESPERGSSVGGNESQPIPAYCDWCGPEDDLCRKYGEPHLARALAFEGANTRLKRVLRKAQSGAKIKIGVLGGSVSKGHGVKFEAQWPTLYGAWWSAAFPRAEVQVLNGAVAATTSDYYATCFLEHIDADVDVVVVELAINDQRGEVLAQSYEYLVRMLLGLPNAPAVVNLQIMALALSVITTGGDLHTAIAMYYDTPIVSVRNFLLPHILYHHASSPSTNKGPQTPGEDYWFVHNYNGDIDLRHMNTAGHALMSELLVIFTRRTLCAVMREDTRSYAIAQTPRDSGFNHSHLPGDEVLDYIPRMRIFDKYDAHTVVGPAHPTCMSTAATKHPLIPIEAQTRGWATWAAEERPDKVYLRATEPGAHIAFALRAGEEGIKVLKVTYLKSKTFGMGSVACWIDDERRRSMRLDGWWNVDGV
ncbi:hypothetical protein C8R46DRAFT_1107294 [Mycena filopes]|nr:hypothetical protein C8R46DRAFT_1107294 [Mycena filopes]